MIIATTLVALAALVWYVSSQGAIRATVIAIGSLFAVLIAFNLFEPIAVCFEWVIGLSASRSEPVALICLYVALGLFWPAIVDASAADISGDLGRFENVTRFVAAGVTSYATVGVFITGISLMSPAVAAASPVILNRLSPEKLVLQFTDSVYSGAFKRKYRFRPSGNTDWVPVQRPVQATPSDNIMLKKTARLAPDVSTWPDRPKQLLETHQDRELFLSQRDQATSSQSMTEDASPPPNVISSP